MKKAKSKKKTYYGSKAVDATCRNHGSCIYCRNNRLFNNKKKELAVKQALKERCEDNDYQ